ncbi:MAG: hypothetical protein P1V81_07855 [Planctomycetota bacterium]|nr:hypothetical protein [Planctomycetota bacterium]
MTRSPRWLLAVVALLLLAGLWVLSDSEPGGESVDRLPGRTDASERIDREQPAPAELAAEDTTTPPLGPAADGPGASPHSLREEVAPGSEAASLGPMLGVVHDATAQAAVGAKLRLWSGDAESLRRIAFKLACKPKSAGAELGDTYAEARTDGNGRVPLPTTGPWLLAFAELDGHEAGHLFELAELEGLPGAELRLVPATTTRVRLEDELGNPRPGGLVRVASGDGVHSTRSTVDDEAHHLLHHRGGLLAQLTDTLELDATTEWQGAMRAFEEQQSGEEPAEDPATSPPEEPGARAQIPVADAPAEVVLRTLPMGTLRIELYDSNAQPTRAAIPVIDFELQRRGRTWTHGFNDYDPGGVIEIELPSGTSFQASFRDVADWGSEPVLNEGVMPGPNEPALVWAITSSGTPEVSYRMVLHHPSGRPLASTKVTTRFKARGSGGSSTANSSATTSASGKLELEAPVIVANMLDQEGVTLELQLSVELTEGGMVQTFEVVVPLPPTSIEPLVDLGQLTLVAKPGTARPEPTNTGG